LKLAYTIFFVCTIFSKFLFAQSIVVVNIEFLIDNNENYLNILEEIELSQKDHLDKFQQKESELKKLFNDIEESKLILNENEVNLQIENYNNQLKNFTILVDEFNLHYQNQIVKIREKVLKEIIQLLEKYAIKNKIDLILDSTSYLIASNSIDITEKINNDLKKINLVLEYNDFKKN